VYRSSIDSRGSPAARRSALVLAKGSCIPSWSQPSSPLAGNARTRVHQTDRHFEYVWTGRPSVLPVTGYARLDWSSLFRFAQGRRSPPTPYGGRVKTLFACT
jgi:hypothetical protein